MDDNEDAATALELLLEEAGHGADGSHGSTALAAALEFLPDVMLLDIGLPELDGFEVAKRIRQQAALQNVVLVAMTGYGRENDRQRSWGRASITTWSSRANSGKCCKSWRPSRSCRHDEDPGRNRGYLTGHAKGPNLAGVPEAIWCE